MQTSNIIGKVARIVAAFILLQTLFFKFTAHPDSVLLFSTLGVEPFGRIGLGVLELITAILLLVPSTTRFGGIMTTGLMVGALATHLFIVGIDFNGDGGLLFGLALVTFICGLIVTFLHKEELFADLRKVGVLPQG